jgi:hypothetical protein
MDYLEDEEFEKFIEHKTCRGCGNHCLLSNPNCNRSKIFIKDEYEKFLDMKKN